MKIFKTLTMAVILLFHLGINAQGYDGWITKKINLETKTNLPFSSHTTSKFKGDSTIFKGLPSSNYNTKSAILFARIGFDSIFMYISDSDDNTRICIVDANKNRDFSDDYLYVVNKVLYNENFNFPPQLIKIRRKVNNEIVTIPQFYAPTIININDVTEMGLSYFELHEGKLNLDSKNYIVWADRQYQQNSEKTLFAISDSANFSTNEQIMKFYMAKNRIILDSNLIVDAKLNSYNSVLSLRIKPIKIASSEELIGTDEEFFAPKFKGTDIITKKTVNLASMQGNYVLIDFWGTWCNPCIKLLPHLVTLHNQYKQLKIISIASNENKDSANQLPEFIKKHEMNWVNLCDFELPLDKKISKIFDVMTYPTLILIDPSGKIIHRGGSRNIQLLDLKLADAFNKDK